MILSKNDSQKIITNKSNGYNWLQIKSLYYILTYWPLFLFLIFIIFFYSCEEVFFIVGRKFFYSCKEIFFIIAKKFFL